MRAIASLNDIGGIENFISEKLFFHHFIFVLDTRISRLAEDTQFLQKVGNQVIGSCKSIGDIQKRYLQADFSQDLNDVSPVYYEEQIAKFFYAIASFSDDVISYSLEHCREQYKKYIVLHGNNIEYCNMLQKILFEKRNVDFYHMSKYLQLFYLSIHLGDISKYLAGINIDFSEKKEAFYYHMLCFTDTSFYNTDYKKSYYHLLEAEKIFPEFSQIYALKVRTLYFLAFNHYRVSDQWEARKKMINPHNPVYQRIQENIELSHKYKKNNNGIYTFELALYLHCGDWKGVRFFLKHYNRLQERDIIPFLWIGKFFYRQGYYKQAYFYLYTRIGEGKYKFAIHKARFILSIVSENNAYFQKERDYILGDRDYTCTYLRKISEHEYSNGSDVYENIFRDSNILLPAKKESGGQLLLEDIDIELLQVSEKGNWETIFLFSPKK